MTGAKAYLHKVVRMRRRLIKSGQSQRSILQISEALKPIEGWLEAYPQASDQAAAKVIRSNYSRIRILIPGAGCTAHNKLIQELDSFINPQIKIEL